MQRGAAIPYSWSHSSMSFLWNITFFLKSGHRNWMEETRCSLKSVFQYEGKKPYTIDLLFNKLKFKIQAVIYIKMRKGMWWNTNLLQLFDLVHSQ